MGTTIELDNFTYYASLAGNGIWIVKRWERWATNPDHHMQALISLPNLPREMDARAVVEVAIAQDSWA
jgi:hypothetical protein